MGSARTGHAGFAIRNPELPPGSRPKTVIEYAAPRALEFVRRVGISGGTKENNSRQRRAAVPAAVSHRAGYLLQMPVWKTTPRRWEGSGYQQPWSLLHDR